MKHWGIAWRIGVSLICLALAACLPAQAATSTATPLPTGTPVAQPTEPAPTPDDIVTAAVAFLSEQRGVPVDQVTVKSAQPVDWTDSCLGLGGAAESCLAAITPGYNIFLDAGGMEYEVHTNGDGSAVRIK